MTPSLCLSIRVYVCLFVRNICKAMKESSELQLTAPYHCIASREWTMICAIQKYIKNILSLLLLLASMNDDDDNVFFLQYAHLISQIQRERGKKGERIKRKYFVMFILDNLWLFQNLALVRAWYARSSSLYGCYFLISSSKCIVVLCIHTHIHSFRVLGGRMIENSVEYAEQEETKEKFIVFCDC